MPEADPTFDIEGIDATPHNQIAVAFGIPTQLMVYRRHYQTEATDIEYGTLAIALSSLGITKRSGSQIELRHPTLIPEKRLIANVEGA